MLPNDKGTTGKIRKWIGRVLMYDNGRHKSKKLPFVDVYILLPYEKTSNWNNFDSVGRLAITLM